MKDDYIVSHKKASKIYAQSNFYANQKHHQDASSSLELQHIQNQNFVDRQVQQDIRNDYERDEELNYSKNSQIRVQNQDEEESFAEVDFERNNDGSYSQFWRQS